MSLNSSANFDNSKKFTGSASLEDRDKHMKTLQRQNEDLKKTLLISEEEHFRYEKLTEDYKQVTKNKIEFQKKLENTKIKNQQLHQSLDSVQIEKKSLEDSLNEKNREIENLRKTLNQARNLEHERSFAIEQNRDYDMKVKNLEKENKDLAKNLQKKVKSTSKMMDQFNIKGSKRPVTSTKKTVDYNRAVMDMVTPARLKVDKQSAKDLNILEEYERLSNQFKKQNDDLMRKTAEFDNLDTMYKYISNVLKQTQKTLDECQNDNFILKSENNRLSSEIQTYKIRNKENENLFTQLSELKTQKFNLEKKIQDLLSIDTSEGKSGEVREKIEMRSLENKVHQLDSIIIEKTTKISELEDTVHKYQNENNKLKMELTSTTTRYDERERERMSYEHQMNDYYNKDSDFIQGLNFMKTAEVPLQERLGVEDGAYDATDLHSCIKHIERLRLEKGRLASELERVQTIISTYKTVEDGLVDKHRVELDLLQKQVKAYISRNDELAKKNDALTRTVNEIKSHDGQNRGEEPDTFARINEETSKLDTDHNYLEVYIDKAEVNEKNIRDGIKMKHEKDVTSFQSVVTLDFMNNDPITSNIVSGAHPNFNTFCRFRFKIDEFAIKYLESNYLTLELYSLCGNDCFKAGTYMLPLRELLVNSDQENFKVQTILKFEDDTTHSGLADLHISLRLRNPLSFAKEWLKEKLELTQSTQAVFEKKSLTVNILQGRNIVNPLAAGDAVEPLVFFRFYNFNERWTNAVASAAPEWNSNFTFEIFMNPSVSNYLQSESLILQVMDNKAQDGSNYIGYVDLPLYRLIVEGQVRDWYNIKSPTVKGSQGMIYVEARLDRLTQTTGKERNVVLVEQLVRDKLNETHKRAKAIGQPDCGFRYIFDSKKNQIDYYTFKKGLREKLKIVIDEIVADRVFKELAGNNQSFDRTAWVEVLNKHDYIGDFDIIENKMRDFVKGNEQLRLKLETNDENNNGLIELYKCAELLYAQSQISEFSNLMLTKADIEYYLKNSRFLNEHSILYKDMVLNYEPDAKFKLKDNAMDGRKNLLRAFDANVHMLFIEKNSELRKARFLEVLEKVNAAGSCMASFDLMNEVADEIFNKNELVEYDVEVIVDKMKVTIDHGRVFSRLLVDNGQIESFKNFLESRVVPVMKVTRCELNYDLLSQMRDIFVTNPRYKSMLNDHLHNHYIKRYVSNLIGFLKDDFVQEQLKYSFKRILIEEIKYTLHKAGSDLSAFVKYLKDSKENETISYEQLCVMSNEFPAFYVEDKKWYSTVVQVVKIYNKEASRPISNVRINGTDFLKFLNEV